MPLKLSVLVPLYNEEEFIETLLRRVVASPLPAQLELEIIVVDDGSTDRSVAEAAAVAAEYPGIIRILRNERNQGKTACLKKAIGAAEGDFAIVQDSDLEYDPAEYPRLLLPLIEGRADAVYGSRFASIGERRVLYFWHSLANHILTGVCNILADLNLTDMETCYKAFRMPLLKSIPIESRRFGFEPEITMKLAKRQARIYEVPVSYRGRTYEEGKKIRLVDALEALVCLLRFWPSRNIYSDKDKSILDAFSEAPRFNAWMSETISRHVGQEVLEIGAGIGNLTRVLARGRRRYVSSDYDLEHLERLRSRLSGRPRLETRLIDVSREDDFADLAGQMDTVVCLNVVEHIEDDVKALKNIHSALRADGRAIILVPEGQSIFSSLDEELGHFRRYSEDQLHRAMNEAGFEVEQILRFNRISRPGWWLNGKILKRRTISRFQLKTFDRMVWLWRRLDSKLPWSPTSIIAIGRKRSSGNDARSRGLAAFEKAPAAEFAERGE